MMKFKAHITHPEWGNALFDVSQLLPDAGMIVVSYQSEWCDKPILQPFFDGEYDLYYQIDENGDVGTYKSIVTGKVMKFHKKQMEVE